MRAQSRNGPEHRHTENKIVDKKKVVRSLDEGKEL